MLPTVSEKIAHGYLGPEAWMKLRNFRVVCSWQNERCQRMHEHPIFIDGVRPPDVHLHATA